MKHTPKEQLADLILASGRRTNRPCPNEKGKRIVGWIIDADDAGLSDAIFAIEEIEKRAKKEVKEFPAADGQG